MANVKALVDLAKLFEVPAIISSSVESGANGPVLAYITENLPNARVIKR